MRAALVSEARRKGRRRNGISRANSASAGDYCLVGDRLTSRLQFLCADMDELLNLLRSHVFARPGILPSRFGFDHFGLGMVGILPSLGRRPRPVFGFEDVFEERHGGRQIAGRPQAVLNGLRRARDRWNATREGIAQKGRSK